MNSPMALAALEVYREAVRDHSLVTGGRVLHQLLPDPRNAVVVVGFAAGTRARDLVDGARTPHHLSGPRRRGGVRGPA
ncbi:hypothetical protein ACFWM5_03210 [Streptomyces bobili]|uniref:hypothetical protein n=1 Tax=Streptomyces bobili TaxID=67280 RepID=UPI0036518EEF